MKSFAALLLLLGLATICNGQSECQCGGFIVREDYSEWFYSFLTFFQEDCNDLDSCQKDCYNFISNLTNNGDLTSRVPDEYISFGDSICEKVNHEVPNSQVQFDYQLCSSPWYNTGMICTYPFCCIGGDFPETGCPA